MVNEISNTSIISHSINSDDLISDISSNYNYNMISDSNSDNSNTPNYNGNKSNSFKQDMSNLILKYNPAHYFTKIIKNKWTPESQLTF